MGNRNKEARVIVQMRKTAFVCLLLLPLFSSAKMEDISPSWLNSHSKDYTTHYILGKGVVGMPPIFLGGYSMPCIGCLTSEPPAKTGAVIWQMATFDSATSTLHLKGYLYQTHVLHGWTNPDEMDYCEPLFLSHNFTLPSSEESKQIAINTYNPDATCVLYSTWAGPVYYCDYNNTYCAGNCKKQTIQPIYLFEREFYYGPDLKFDNYGWVSLAVNFVYPAGSPAPPPPPVRVYKQKKDFLDATQNQGYPLLVRKKRIGYTDSLGNFEITTKISRDQHILFGEYGYGYDLRQLFVQDYRIHLNFQPEYFSPKTGMDLTALREKGEFSGCSKYVCRFTNASGLRLRITKLKVFQEGMWCFIKRAPGMIEKNERVVLEFYFPTELTWMIENSVVPLEIGIPGHSKIFKVFFRKDSQKA